MHFDTLAIQATHQTDPATGAVVAPLHLSTTFERDEDYHTVGSHVYARTSNPNRNTLERALATLDRKSVV